MRKGIFLTIVCLLLIGTLILTLNMQPAVSAEPPEVAWTETYGGTGDDRARSLVQIEGDGYALAGRTTSYGAGGYDFWLVVVDHEGHALWNQTYGRTGTEYAHSVVQTSDTGYALAGYTTSFGAGSSDFWLVKTDSAGHMQWNQTYGGSTDDRAETVVQTSDGGYAIAGYTTSFGAGQHDFWLVKTDENGTMEWNRTYGGTGHEQLYSMIKTSDGGYLLVGETRTWGAGHDDFWIVKTNATGHMEWAQTYGGTLEDDAKAAVETNEGGYALAGNTASSGAGNSDFWVIKTNATGDTQWSATFGGTNYDSGESIAQTNDGGYAVSGFTESFGAGSRDFWLIKLDASGTAQWNQTYGGAGSDTIHRSMIQTSDSGYALAGWTSSYGAGSNDFWLVKLASPTLPASIDITPKALNVKSRGNWITAYLELPDGYDVNTIPGSSVQLNNTVPAEDYPTFVGDEDNDGAPDLMVKFDRSAVIHFIATNVLLETKFTEVTLEVSGTLDDGTPFAGSDTIKVIWHPTPNSE